MSNENPTSTRVSAGALYDNTSAAGEYLFSVMMVMLAALGKALARLFAAIGRRSAGTAWLYEWGAPTYAAPMQTGSYRRA